MPSNPDQPEAKPPLANIANLLTMLRLALVPVFVVLFVHDHAASGTWRLAAAGVFLAAAITDHYDGHLARTRGIITDFGKLADPIADKALVASALICLSAFGLLSWWVTGIILGRELIVTVIRFAVKKHQVIAASWGGKIKTVTQISAIVGYLLPLGWFAEFGWFAHLGWLVDLVSILMILAVAATVATGVDYAVTAWQIVRRAQRSADESGEARVSGADGETDKPEAPGEAGKAGRPQKVEPARASPAGSAGSGAPVGAAPSHPLSVPDAVPPVGASAQLGADTAPAAAGPPTKRPRIRFRPVPTPASSASAPTGEARAVTTPPATTPPAAALAPAAPAPAT
ncbi:MAG: CDP-diacylglycerol--glycerol-3-phosphate 3-phosphatidyltransferase, partial [Bifidobacteriaceae bacterium]|nr:CDP-diacylglycerol--glycerol-3-phosphate 3-phosphatidyltransferase [Bifidobacteriaceae bacterium]